jgi:hypothetical protein
MNFIAHPASNSFITVASDNCTLLGQCMITLGREKTAIAMNSKRKRETICNELLEPKQMKRYGHSMNTRTFKVEMLLAILTSLIGNFNLEQYH